MRGVYALQETNGHQSYDHSSFAAQTFTSFAQSFFISNIRHQGMTSILPSHHYKWSTGVRDNYPKDKLFKMSAPCSTRSRFRLSSFLPVFGHKRHSYHQYQSTRKCRHVLCRASESNRNSGGSEDEDKNPDSSGNESNGIDNEFLRENLERMIGANDSSFNGLDLATLIRNKYGRSYDVQLIKKEFMGKNLLALNVMWKYMEQRSFPLTEEEYILRLDDVANTLRCWGAVSHIRNSLAKSRERPRIGKAVSIFIDMDESGGRANEWIYK